MSDSPVATREDLKYLKEELISSFGQTIQSEVQLGLSQVSEKLTEKLTLLQMKTLENRHDIDFEASKVKKLFEKMDRLTNRLTDYPDRVITNEEIVKKISTDMVMLHDDVLELKNQRKFMYYVISAFGTLVAILIATLVYFKK